MKLQVLSKVETKLEFEIRFGASNSGGRYRFTSLPISVLVRKDAYFGKLREECGALQKEHPYADTGRFHDQAKLENRAWFEGIRIGDVWELKAQPDTRPEVKDAARVAVAIGSFETEIGLPSPKDSKAPPLVTAEGVTLPDHPMHRAGGMTAAEFAAGAARLPKPPKLPHDFDSIRDEFERSSADGHRFGDYVLAGIEWLSGKLWPNDAK